MRVGVAVLAYEASTTIERVLDDLAPVAASTGARILVADDRSADATVAVARRWADAHPELDVTVGSNGSNRGYGGNQKVAIGWAREQALDALVVLHGDRQHDPADIASMLAPIERGDADAVFAARTLVPGSARAGGMPRHRYVANRMLSGMQNALAGTDFSEWHSGFRAYRLDALDDVELADLPDWFDFDCSMTLALADRGRRVREVPCTTRYTDEVSRVPLIRYGLRVVQLSVAHWSRGRRVASERSNLPVRSG